MKSKGIIMSQQLILIRGLPGSGKSTLAKMFADECHFSHFEADMFFITNGIYTFNPKLLNAAHAWCLDRTATQLSNGANVVVSNTFSQKWEMEPYTKLAEKLYVNIKIIECQSYFGSIHNVPAETIAKMQARWEH
jgi:predicted kinase